MKKIYVFALLFMMVAAGCSTNNSNVNSQNTINFPDDFVLKTAEIPKNFEIKPIDESAKEAGFESNPGYVKNPELLKTLYDEVDLSLIDKVYSSVYQDDSDSSNNLDLGVIVVEYKNEEALNGEIKKIHSGIEIHSAKEGITYFRRENYLVLVWSDGASHPKEVKEVSNALKERLGLEAVE